MTYLTIWEVLLLVVATSISTLYITYKVTHSKKQTQQRKVKFIDL